MSKTLSKDEVAALARLARLKLTDKEIAKYQKDLDSIFEYFEILDKADITGLKPTSQVTGLENVTREDVVKDQTASPSKLLKGAPDSQDEYVKVRRML